MAIALYFVGNRLIARGPSPWWSDSDPGDFQSVAHFCPTCGEVWGRVVIEGASWWVTINPCAKHPQGSWEGGSFIQPWRRTFKELPPEVLKYELQLRLERVKSEPEQIP